MAAYPDSMSGEKWSKEEKENLGKGVKQQFQGMLLQRSVELFSCIDGSSGDPNNIDSIISSIKDFDFNPERVRLFLPKVNWEQLAVMYVPCRSGQNVRWLKTLHPARKRVGKWTAEEDKRMKIAVTLFGPKIWKKVARCVPGRTQVQCRERWVNCLDPSLNMAGWSVEEDSKLEAAIAEYGYCWSKVAACVPPRTDNQCRRRWKVLFPNEVPLLQAARKIQKAALISNFVDRESERSALGPNDFLQPETNLLTGSQNFVASQRKKRSRGSEVCERIEKDASGNAATISNATQTGLDEVPRLTNGSELENMHRRPVSRKEGVRD